MKIYAEYRAIVKREIIIDDKFEPLLQGFEPQHMTEKEIEDFEKLRSELLDKELYIQLPDYIGDVYALYDENQKVFYSD